GYHVHQLQLHRARRLLIVYRNNVGLGKVGHEKERPVHRIIADVGLLLRGDGRVPEIDRHALVLAPADGVVALVDGAESALCWASGGALPDTPGLPPMLISPERSSRLAAFSASRSDPRMRLGNDPGCGGCPVAPRFSSFMVLSFSSSRSRLLKQVCSRISTVS